MHGDAVRLAPDQELAAYRIVQQGLTNVVTHAEAHHAWVDVSFAAKDLTLSIQDDGRGFTPPDQPADLARHGHFGLMGMRERAMLYGGHLQYHFGPWPWDHHHGPTCWSEPRSGYGKLLRTPPAKRRSGNTAAMPWRGARPAGYTGGICKAPPDPDLCCLVPLAALAATVVFDITCAAGGAGGPGCAGAPGLPPFNRHR